MSDSGVILTTDIPQVPDFPGNLQRAVDKRRLAIRAVVMGSAINDHMRNAPGGGRRSPSDTGPLRRVTGRLARSLTGTQTGGVSESVDTFTWENLTGTITYGSKVPYAGVHEDGFTGTVKVPAHSRTMTMVFGRPIVPITVQVRSHNRNMNIPARPYLGPAQSDTNERVLEMLTEAILEVMRAAE